MIGMETLEERDKRWEEEIQNSTGNDPIVNLVIFIILVISAVITFFII